MNHQLLAEVKLEDTLFGNNPAKNVADSPTEFLSAILPNIYVFAGLILLVYLVFGGFVMITAAGNSEQSQKGQQAITNAIIGFLIIFASFWIIQILEVITGIPILNSSLAF